MSGNKEVHLIFTYTEFENIIKLSTNCATLCNELLIDSLKSRSFVYENNKSVIKFNQEDQFDAVLDEIISEVDTFASIFDEDLTPLQIHPSIIYPNLTEYIPLNKNSEIVTTKIGSVNRYFLKNKNPLIGDNVDNPIVIE